MRSRRWPRARSGSAAQSSTRPCAPGGQLVRLAPYRESGCVRLMEALAAQGNTAEALLAYEQLRVRLREDLGAIPGPQVQALHSRLLGGRPRES